ncbi:hypothetical protein [Peterkaempfera sp. SMS 1(5)a]|uniref:hypothetical protein n=1 Tax=Peterkaempfera podocarpi TaxID=3232308 RepID=UPI00366C9CAF
MAIRHHVTRQRHGATRQPLSTRLPGGRTVPPGSVALRPPTDPAPDVPSAVIGKAPGAPRLWRRAAPQRPDRTAALPRTTP